MEKKVRTAMNQRETISNEYRSGVSLAVGYQRVRDWIAALRSGLHQQGKGKLHSKNETFCCFGVACDIDERFELSREEFVNEYSTILNETRYASTIYLPLELEYPICLATNGRISLMACNDSEKFSFEEIANLLEWWLDGDFQKVSDLVVSKEYGDYGDFPRAIEDAKKQWEESFGVQVTYARMRKWSTALKSGDYKQTSGKLCTFDVAGEERNCCLGVLARIDERYQRVPENKLYFGVVEKGICNSSCASLPLFYDYPNELAQFKTHNGIALNWVSMNDHYHLSFNAIAKIIDLWIEDDFEELSRITRYDADSFASCKESWRKSRECGPRFVRGHREDSGLPGTSET